MFDTADAVVPLATAVQWVLAIVGAAGAIVGYVWRWTLKREDTQQARLDAIRQTAQKREETHSAELMALLNDRLEDRERWRQTFEQVLQRVDGA